MSENIEIKFEEEITETENYPYAIVVKFRGEGKPYTFGTYKSEIKKDDWVVVETQQGLELGQVQADAMKTGQYGIHVPNKPVVRKASPKDMRDFEDNKKMEEKAFSICNEEIRELGLDMRLLSASYTLDRSKILFVYVADQRVDFRELLKRLGSSLHCRIELRQIGERDKAKMESEPVAWSAAVPDSSLILMSFPSTWLRISYWHLIRKSFPECVGN